MTLTAIRPLLGTGKPRVKCLLQGRRTALSVCQAIRIAMTVVLPARTSLMIDVRSVRLLLRREAFAFVEVQFLLTAPKPLFRLRDRCDELGPPPFVDQVSGGLTRFVELPMLMRVLVRRVDDRPVEERVRHYRWSLIAAAQIRV